MSLISLFTRTCLVAGGVAALSLMTLPQARAACSDPAGPRVDWSGCELLGVDLVGADLSNADLRGANLEGADLEGIDLRSANLWKANMRGANLSGADLRKANMPEAILSDQEIMDRLQDEGIDIARRTVAKYREMMNIPTSVKRKRLRKAEGLTPGRAMETA